ncbi:MAG: hypothetical protein O7D94_04410 [Planctomycetota bacterium]|nr:hypothetical protein [Planctomycetota bacterium]
MSVRLYGLRSAVPGRSRLHSARTGYRLPGLTLIELAITMGLVVLLASIAWPLMSGRITKAELPDSADRIRSMLFMARSGAVMEHRRHRVRFEPGEQQPIIEYEVDPIREPGVWEPLTAKWTEEPVLLGDVQVHEVEIGRPFWTRPLAATDQPEDLEEEAEEALLTGDAESGLEEMALLWPDAGMEDVEIDENRPSIIFEVDGSSDWATLYLARVDPEDELLEEEPQLWIVLDGRTAVARIQEKIDEATLADPDFYVAREDLELPDTVDLDNLTLATSSEEALVQVTSGFQGSDRTTTEFMTESEAAERFAGASGTDRRNGDSRGGFSNGGLSEDGRRTGRGGADGGRGESGGDGSGAGSGDGSGDSNGSDPSDMNEANREAMSKLEEALANSDMSDAEKAEIRRMFEEALRDQSGQ